MADVSEIPGLQALWSRTFGSPRVLIAVLDGDADLRHPSLQGSNVRRLPPLHPSSPCTSTGIHGTFITSIIFGQHLRGGVRGVAPACRGILLPLYGTDGATHCTQKALAAAIRRAVAAGADIINISAGELFRPGSVEPDLLDAIRLCNSRNALVLAATGNDGCECQSVPASLPGVLAIGAMDLAGRPLPMSNWGAAYRANGVLAVGKDLIGAHPALGTASFSGSSVATAVASGVCGLLLSIGKSLHGHRAAQGLRHAILHGVDPCLSLLDPDCRRVLVGRMNISRTTQLFLKGATPLSTMSPPAESLPVGELPAAAVLSDASSGVEPACEGKASCSCNEGKSGCGCGGNATAIASTMQLKKAYAGGEPLPKVYAIGQLGIDFESEAKRDALSAQTDGAVLLPATFAPYLTDRRVLIAESVIWTLEDDAGVAVCAIQPQGPFAREGYQALVEFLKDQEASKAKKAPSARFIAVPGHVVGQAFLAIAGRVVPVVQPDLDGMSNPDVDSLVDAAIKSLPEKTLAAKKEDDARQFVRHFLEVSMDKLQNLGITAEDRARNYAVLDVATTIRRFFEPRFGANVVLEAISASPSRSVPTGRNYQNVVLSFFNPADMQQANLNITVVIDVTDVRPRLVEVRPVSYSRFPAVV